MKFKGATREELFMYFLLIAEYKNDLFVKGDGCSYMPEENEIYWDEISYKIMEDLNLRHHTLIDGELYTHDGLWEFLRQMWKIDCSEEKYNCADIVSSLWGDLQGGNI